MIDQRPRNQIEIDRSSLGETNGRDTLPIHQHQSFLRKKAAKIDLGPTIAAIGDVFVNAAASESLGFAA